MTHKDEIQYWAEHQDGMIVQFRTPESIFWYKTDQPQWKPRNVYIVDNEWAFLRKAQREGKQLQCLNYFNPGWTDVSLDIDATKVTTPEEWRIKPAEPKYEYQWIYEIQPDTFVITEHMTPEEADNASKALGIAFEQHQSSKREVK